LTTVDLRHALGASESLRVHRGPVSVNPATLWGWDRSSSIDWSAERGLGIRVVRTPGCRLETPGKKKLGKLERIDYAVRRAAGFSVTTGSAVTAIVTGLCQNPGKSGSGYARKANNRAKTRKARISQKPLGASPCGFESHSRYFCTALHGPRPPVAPGVGPLAFLGGRCSGLATPRGSFGFRPGQRRGLAPQSAPRRVRRGAGDLEGGCLEALIAPQDSRKS
jgi:hypothetical protein